MENLSRTSMKNNLYLDLFAGAGGLSEGFIQAGFEPIAHIEMNAEACDTLRTRTAFHFLKGQDNIEPYNAYLRKEITRDELWGLIPQKLLESVIQKEIRQDTLRDIFSIIDKKLQKKQLDIIIGGPPCQAYSTVGRSRDPNRMRGDNRNYLYKFYAMFLKRYQPNYFIFENVVGLLTAGNSSYFNEMCELFIKLGYSIDYKVLNAADYRVLQNRKRVIIVGSKNKHKFSFPAVISTRNRWQVKQDLFDDLPYLKPGEEKNITRYSSSPSEYLQLTEIRSNQKFTTQHITRNHNKRDLKIYEITIKNWLSQKRRLKYTELPVGLQTHKNKTSFLDRYKVVDPCGVSHTVVAHIAKDGHYYIYPDLNQIRSISVREAARIQSFQDNYFFEGGRTAAFKQIGNAVPPLFATELAKAVKMFLKTNQF